MKHESESRTGGRTRPGMITVVAVVLILASSLIALHGSVRDLYSEYQIGRLLESAYNQQRPGSTRLSGASYSGKARTGALDPNIGRAQRLLIGYPDSLSHKKLQSRIHLALGDWPAAAKILEELTVETSGDAAILNNLGVAYVALGETDGNYLFRALETFELAAEKDPEKLEPRFNIAVVYRKFRLPGLAAQAELDYANLDPSSSWNDEFRSAPELDEGQILQQLRATVAEGRSGEASELIARYPEIFRRTAMSYALGNVAEDETLVVFIGQEFARRFGDRTISAMLQPLLSIHRERLLTARQLVYHGAELYLQGNLARSLDDYARADELVKETDSVIDRYWIDLNRVDTIARLGDFKTARQSLEVLIAGTRTADFKWLHARALSIYGSAVWLSSSYKAMIDSLSEAERIFLSIGAETDTVRPLYYLAGYTYRAGDYAEALRLALKCLSLAEDSDSVRKTSLFSLMFAGLYRAGFPAKAGLFAAESVEESKKTGNETLVSMSASILASLFESTSERVEAEKYLSVAEEAFLKIHSDAEKTRAELVLNALKGRMQVNRKRYVEAEYLLKKNLDIYSKLPFRLSYLYSESLMLLGRLLYETGRTEEAGETFRRAIETVENDDEYLRAEKLRVAFDDQRRELYDSAIAFEYDQGATEIAWSYVQKYRAKLFLEFLAQFNSGIEDIRSEALNRFSAQKRIPSDTQVIEYVLLKDRLLIWVSSKGLFKARAVAVTREALEQKIQTAIGRLRTRNDAQLISEELFNWLISPVADLLNPNFTIAIIPDRALHGLPFGALRNPRNGRYLVQDYPLVVSPSLTQLLASDAAAPRRDSIVAFGAQTGDASGVQELSVLQNLYARSATFTGKQVDKAAFLNAIETTPIFHYAGHSVKDAVDPLRSAILLDGNRFGPNSVTAIDIVGRQLQPNALIVLSSCDSSVGNSRDGVGMRGLTSAFLIAGAGSVVGSLWPVETSSTSELMVGFHRAVASTRTPVADALRAAQLSFIESASETSHPYYWSGFVVTGNFSALR